MMFYLSVLFSTLSLLALYKAHRYLLDFANEPIPEKSQRRAKPENVVYLDNVCNKRLERIITNFVDAEEALVDNDTESYFTLRLQAMKEARKHLKRVI